MCLLTQLWPMFVSFHLILVMPSPQSWSSFHVSTTFPLNIAKPSNRWFLVFFLSQSYTSTAISYPFNLKLPINTFKCFETSRDHKARFALQSIRNFYFDRHFTMTLHRKNPCIMILMGARESITMKNNPNLLYNDFTIASICFSNFKS